jgi:hypothetical protein
MSVTELIFGGKTRATVGVVQFDASVSEVHTDEMEITDHPVEEGSDISDHIRKMPITLEMNGVITNNPIVFLASARAKSPVTTDTGNTSDRVGTGYDKLRELQETGERIDVATSLRDYSNMVIQSLSISRDVSTGNILDATLTLREIIVAKQLTVDLPVPIKVAKKKETNKGNKNKTAATDAQDQSLLDKGREWAQSGLSSLLGG